MFRLVPPSFIVLLWSVSSPAHSAIVFESGALGQTGLTFADFVSNGAPKGSGVDSDVFSGVRFELAEPALTTRIGGHFVVEPGHDTSFFGAIVKLDSFNDFPDSGDLSSADVVGVAHLEFPATSTEVYGSLETQLAPGVYALIFGSGLFGDSGSGAAVLNNPDIGSPSYIGYQSVAGWLDLTTLPGPFENFRFVLEGALIPEPYAFDLALMGLTSSVFLSRSC